MRPLRAQNDEALWHLSPTLHSIPWPTLHPPPPLCQSSISDAAVRGKQKSDNKRPIQADDFPETKPEHWRRVKEAGVMFWFNDVTGVATDDCPHESLWSLIERERELKERARDGKERAAVPKALDDLAFEVGQGEGTGALVYDSSEFEQAMRILDGAARTPGPSPATRTSH